MCLLSITWSNATDGALHRSGTSRAYIVKESGKAKVTDVSSHIVAEKDVARLQIIVYNGPLATVVQIFKCICDVKSNTQPSS
jgi:hypothetical protein